MQRDAILECGIDIHAALLPLLGGFGLVATTGRRLREARRRVPVAFLRDRKDLNSLFLFLGFISFFLFHFPPLFLS